MPETHGVSSWSGPGDVPQGNTKDPEWVLPASGDVRSMKPSTVFDLDHKRLSRLGQMFPMCLAIASIGPSLLIWFQLENLNMVVNVIWEYIYRIQREVNWQKIFKMVRRAARRPETTNMTPKVIIRASKVIIEVGAYDELPTEVANLPDESEYRCCLADTVPDGELEHSGVCDKGVNTDPMREVDLQQMFKTERQAGRR